MSEALAPAAVAIRDDDMGARAVRELKTHPVSSVGVDEVVCRP